VVAALLEETIAEEASDNPLVDPDDPLSLLGSSKLSEPVIPSELAPEAVAPKNITITTAIVLALVLAILILGTSAAIYVFFIAPQ
jgi:hypothetical protein